jgi:hypothetical protein
VAPVTGKGDFTDPYTWQDAIFYLTSELYPIISQEAFQAAGLVLPQPFFKDLEDFTVSVAILGGTLTLNLVTYANWPTEHIQSSAAVVGGTLVLGLVTYANWPTEHIQTSVAITGGTLVIGLLTYTNWPTEHIQTSVAITGGTLT